MDFKLILSHTEMEALDELLTDTIHEFTRLGCEDDASLMQLLKLKEIKSKIDSAERD
ncbi:MAG: hypothetical protein GWN64_07875 [Candidatus Thorarchaeota archaeon]|nr:hypothetical protein [Candidatus Thorarchaeota archaeon]